MLHFVLITPQTSVTSTCGIQHPGAATTAMEVFHNTCNMCIHDLADMDVLSSHASACISGKSMLQLLYIHFC